MFSIEGRKDWDEALRCNQLPVRFSIARLSGRVSRSVRFEPAVSKLGKFTLHFESLPHVNGPRDEPMNFEVRRAGDPFKCKGSRKKNRN